MEIDRIIECCKYWLQEAAMFTSCDETRELLEKRVKQLQLRLEENEGESIPRFIATEIYDNEIRHDGKTIYWGRVANLSQEEREAIINNAKANKTCINIDKLRGGDEV